MRGEEGDPQGRGMKGDLTVVWRERPFRRLALARTVALVADSSVPIALAFAVLAMPGGSATDLGLVLLCRSVAQIICVLFGGVVADRFPRVRVMISADLVAGSAQLIAAGLVITGRADIVALAALATLNGAAAALVLPASSGLLPELVPSHLLKSANALLRLGMNTASIGGAAMAGFVVAVVGPGWALGAAGLAFFGSLLFLLGIRAPGSAAGGEGAKPVPVPREGFFSELAHGWKAFASRRWLWVVVLQFAVLNACTNGGLRVLGPVVAEAELGGAAAWSTIMAAQSGGLLVGTLLVMRIHPRRPLRFGVVATLGFVPPFLLLAAGAPVWAVAMSTLLSGISADFFSVFWSTSLQVHVPNDVLSRISSYDALGSYILGPVGLAVAGPLAERFGPTPVLIACGALTAGATVAALSSSQVRSLPALSTEENEVGANAR
ncbi:MFS transporter [Streptomyces anulatus]